MTRQELQRLCTDRLRDAKALLDARRWSGAYYLAGYAVECALKSCIIAHLMRTDVFPEKRYSEQCWTHNLKQLLVLAGLQDEFDRDAALTPQLDTYWGTIKDWTEKSRYERTIKFRAEQLYLAITDKRAGILPWIKRHW